MEKIENKLRVCHFAQVPCKPFVVDVENEEQAHFISEVLANQHLFLFKNKIIPDYSNVIIVEMWDEDSDDEGNPGWVDYYNEKEGMDFDEFVKTYFEKGE